MIQELAFKAMLRKVVSEYQVKKYGQNVWKQRLNNGMVE